MNEYYSPSGENLISFPSSDIMSFGLKHNIIDSPGLLMHTFLCRTITSLLINKLPNKKNIELKEALDHTTVYHFSRQEADYGKAGKSKNKNTNKYMQNHSDMEYSLQEAKKYGFEKHILEGIKSFIINPKERDAYFPNETLEINGQIDWIKTIPMLTSWLVSGAITNIQSRFDDLKERRSSEIGKLELSYIKSSLLQGKNINTKIPKPILDIAKNDSTFNINNESDLIKLIQNGDISNKVMGIWILNGYEQWANYTIKQYCKLCNIVDFDSFIKKGLDLSTNEEHKLKIEKEFECFLGRKLLNSEYIPYLPGINLIFNRLAMLKIDTNKTFYKRRVYRILKNLEKIIRRI